MELLLLEALPEGSALPNEADILSIAMESVFLENSAPDGRENEVDSIVDECLSLIEVCGLFYSFSLYPPSIVTLSCLYAAVRMSGELEDRRRRESSSKQSKARPLVSSGYNP